MVWVESEGGPLVVVPVQGQRQWRGAFGGPSEGYSDYDRACEVVDELAVLKHEDMDVLVLGDEPLPTAWVQRDRGGLFVRWVYGSSEDEVVSSLSGIQLDALAEDAQGQFSVPGPCILFDSAEPGSSIKGDSLVIDLLPGVYALRSALIDPSPQVRLLLHQMVRI